MSNEIERLSAITISAIGQPLTDRQRQCKGRQGNHDYPKNLRTDCITCTKQTTGILSRDLQCQICK